MLVVQDKMHGKEKSWRCLLSRARDKTNTCENSIYCIVLLCFNHVNSHRRKKNVKLVSCEQQNRRQPASAQSDQRICLSLS